MGRLMLHNYFVSALLVALAAASSVNGQVFTYSGSVQSYTIPATGIYAISVSGARGTKGKRPWRLGGRRFRRCFTGPGYRVGHRGGRLGRQRRYL